MFLTDQYNPLFTSILSGILQVIKSVLDITDTIFKHKNLSSSKKEKQTNKKNNSSTD